MFTFIQKVDRAHNGGLRLYTGMCWKEALQSFLSTLILANKLNIVWKNSHVSFFGIKSWLIWRQEIYIFYFMNKSRFYNGLVLKTEKNRMVSDVTCIFLFIPWLTFNKQTGKKRLLFPVYTNNIFQEALEAKKHVLMLLFPYHLRWVSLHAIRDIYIYLLRNLNI